MEGSTDAKVGGVVPATGSGPVGVIQRPAESGQPDANRRRVLTAIAGTAIASPEIANALTMLTRADRGAPDLESLEAQDQPGYYPPTRVGCAAAIPGLSKAPMRCGMARSRSKTPPASMTPTIW